jgi:hypothetical protein
LGLSPTHAYQRLNVKKLKKSEKSETEVNSNFKLPLQAQPPCKSFNKTFSEEAVATI